jgi:drug/metabolite transporter (DMT)-like permease
MTFILPLIASILQASSFTIDKSILNIRRLTYKNYIAISFPLIAILTWIIFLIFRPPLTTELFKGKFFYLILASFTITIITNLLFYRALKSELLSELQTISLLKDIPLIIFAAIIFPSERNIPLIILALIATISIIWSHWKKGHFHIAKKTLPYLLWIIFAASFSGIIAKEILTIWSPISFQLIRNTIAGIIFLIIFSRYIKTTPKKALPYLLLTNLLSTIAWILYFFSFQRSGIIFTVLIFSLQPLLVYLASLFLLKEKFQWKKFTAFIIILITIAISQIIKYT